MITTQATQFVRTQVESWRMKTLLAKALSMQGDYAEQIRKVQHIIEAKTEEHMAILESLEFKISMLEQQVDTITKKLTVLIKILRKTIGQDARQVKNRKEELAVEYQRNHPMTTQAGISMSEPTSEASRNYYVLKM